MKNILVVAVILGWCAAALGQDAGTIIADARQKYEKVSGYCCFMEIREARGPKSENRLMKYYFKKPGTIRIEVLEGKDAGGVALYRDHFVWGRQSGILSAFRMKFKYTDRMVSSAGGATMDQSGWGYILDQIEGASKKENGFSVSEITGKYSCWVLSDLRQETGSSGEKFYIDKETGVVSRHETFENGILVSKDIYREFVINGNFDPSLFDERKF